MNFGKYCRLLFVCILLMLVCVDQSLVWAQSSARNLRYELLTLRDEKAREHYRKAIAYFDDGNPHLTVKELLDALKIEPDNMELLSRCGSLAIETSESFHKRTREIYSKLHILRQGALTEREKVNYARTLFLVEPVKFSESEKLLNSVLKDAPKSVLAMIALGELELMQNKYDFALKTFNAALALDDKQPRALWGIGYAYKGLGDNDKALRAFERAFTFNPNDALNNVKMGKAMIDIGKELHAPNYFGYALEIDPENVDAHIAMVPILLKRNNDMNARVHLRKAMKLDPENPWIYLYQGITLEMWGKLDEAIEKYQAAAYFGPKLIDAKLRLAKIYSGVGHSFPGAVFSNENPNDLMKYKEHFNPEAALILFREVSALDPKHPESELIAYNVYKLQEYVERGSFLNRN